MLKDIFYWVFNMSITATVTGLIIMLISLIPRLPKRFSVILWGIPFLRMALPVGLNARYNLMTLLSKFTAKTVIIYQPSEETAFSMTNFTMAADSYFPVVYKVNLLDSVFSVAAIVWVAVASVILLILIILYYTTVRELKDAVHLTDNIYLSEKVTSPGVYGVIKPKIVLPQMYVPEDMRYVVMHEKTHIRRCDNFLRIAALTLTAIHWFNPFAWLFLKKYMSDSELACDECVLAKLDAHGAKEYANMLLNAEESKNTLVSAFGGAKIYTRVKNILSFKRMTYLAAAAFFLMIAGIFYTLLTNAG